MKSLKNYCRILFAVLILGTTAMPSSAEEAKEAAAKKAPSNEVVERGWKQRCPKQNLLQKLKKKQCEVFQRIDVKESSMRVAEFAVGFPSEKTLEKGAARGVVILPLGILLEQGVEMKVDTAKPLAFKSRYCTNAGCFSYLNLSKDLLDFMKKAKTVTFVFKTSEGQNVNLIMSLNGFEKALKGIQ